MRNWIKKLLGIKEPSVSREDMEAAMEAVESEINKRISEMYRLMDVSKNFMDELEAKLEVVNKAVGPKYVTKKLKGYTSYHEYIELSARIYILDNGWRKQNEPFVKSDSNGRVDEYDSAVGPESKLRCYMLKKIILPGYGNDEKFDPNNENYQDTYEYLFGKSYRELVEYMREFNYERMKEELCSLNFYEL